MKKSSRPWPRTKASRRNADRKIAVATARWRIRQHSAFEPLRSRNPSLTSLAAWCCCDGIDANRGGPHPRGRRFGCGNRLAARSGGPGAARSRRQPQRARGRRRRSRPDRSRPIRPAGRRRHPHRPAARRAGASPAQSAGAGFPADRNLHSARRDDGAIGGRDHFSPQRAVGQSSAGRRTSGG